MGKVVSLHFDGTDSRSDFLKVVTDEGTHLLITEQRGDAASVLQDLDDGLFDDFEADWADTDEDVAAWDALHVNAVQVYPAV